MVETVKISGHHCHRSRTRGDMGQTETREGEGSGKGCGCLTSPRPSSQSRQLRPAHLAWSVPPSVPGTEQVCCDCHGETELCQARLQDTDPASETALWGNFLNLPVRCPHHYRNADLEVLPDPAQAGTFPAPVLALTSSSSL